MENLLKKEDSQIWHEYEDLICKNIRKDSLNKLQEFISSLKNYDSLTLKKIVNYLIDNYSNNPSERTIQHPLFKEIIFPFLIEGYKSKDVGSIRAFVIFEQYFYSDNTLIDRCKQLLNLENFDTENFLDKAIEIDPNNQETISHFVKVLINKLDYWSHELPHGLLVDKDIFINKLEKLILLFENLKEKNSSQVNFINEMKKISSDL